MEEGDIVVLNILWGILNKLVVSKVSLRVCAQIMGILAAMVVSKLENAHVMLV